MDGIPLNLADARLLARPSGALHWPEEGLLCAGDLHLGRAERLARRGATLLPPYDTRETLDRLIEEVARTAPRILVLLGDSFDDGAVVAGLAAGERARLDGLARGRRLVWVAGNHDPGPPGLPGEAAEAFGMHGIVFRHIARPGASGEVSGHHHPKLRLAAGGRGLARPCFACDANRIILPAFGAWTGGLDLRDAAFAPLLGPDARAILTGRPSLSIPLRALRREAFA